MKGNYDIDNIESLSDSVYKGLTPYFYYGLNNEGQRVWTKKIDEAKEFYYVGIGKTIDHIFPAEMHRKIEVYTCEPYNYAILIYWK